MITLWDEGGTTPLATLERDISSQPTAVIDHLTIEHLDFEERLVRVIPVYAPDSDPKSWTYSWISSEGDEVLLAGPAEAMELRFSAPGWQWIRLEAFRPDGTRVIHEQSIVFPRHTGAER